MNLIRKYKIYFYYRKNLKKALPYLSEKYGFTKNIFNEFYTVLDLSDAPQDILNEYGLMWRQREIHNFMMTVHNDMKQFNIYDELGVLEIKELNEVSFGICFGIKNSIFNPRYFFYTKILTIFILTILGIILI